VRLFYKQTIIGGIWFPEFATEIECCRITTKFTGHAAEGEQTLNKQKA